jgi:high mobility group protein B3
MPKLVSTNTNTASMDTVLDKPTKTPITSDTQVVQVVAAQLDRAMEAMAPVAAHGAIPDDLLSSTLAEATQELKIKKPRKERAPKTIPEDGNRCIARTWGGQCKSVKCGNGDYPDLCKGCAVKAAVLNSNGKTTWEEPNSFDKDTVEDGDTKPKRIGLRFGTIKMPLTQLVFAPNGDIASVWPDEQVRALVDQALKEGKKYHPGSKEGSTGKTNAPRKKKEKKEKAPKAKRGKNAYMFFLEAQRGVIKAELEKSESYIGQTVPVTAITKAAGAKWKALSEDEKTPWNEKASQAKAEAEAAVTASASSLDLEEGEISQDNAAAEAHVTATDSLQINTESSDSQGDADNDSEPVEQATPDLSAKIQEIKATIPESGVEKMKVGEIRNALEQLGIETTGKDGKKLSKKELTPLLEQALSGENADGDEEETEADEITLADGTTVYHVEESGLCYNAEGEELGMYNSETNSIEE